MVVICKYIQFLKVLNWFTINSETGLDLELYLEGGGYFFQKNKKIIHN
jgi:hypothetical protein